MTKTVRRVHREPSGRIVYYKIREARCRDCGYTFRVGTADDRKFANAGLCKVCYYDAGNGHEREGLCANPGCDEAVDGRHRYCEAHGEEIGLAAALVTRAINRTVRAMQATAPISERWDTMTLTQRRRVLIRAQGKYRGRTSAQVYRDWREVNAQVRRTIALRLENAIV